MGSRVGKRHCWCCVAGIDIQRSEKINMIFVTMVSIFARFCSVMEMCIAMIMVMSSYFSIGKGFIIHKIIMVVLVTLTVILYTSYFSIEQGFIKLMVVMMVVVMLIVMINLLLNRTRLHQVDDGYDGGGQLTSQ